MSIFKESFREYVKKQLELRQAIISLGNDGNSRFNSRTLKFSQAAGGSKVNIPYGAFYANTLNRTCVIRMCSGADLTHAGVYNVLEPWELDQGITAGSDLAKMYILEGGTLNTGNKHKDFQTVDSNNKPTMDWLINAKPKSGWTNAINKKNSTYGDALTRGNSINKNGDDYGIVPMPGIIDATIKTKSAYGSIREGKINFKCHNQRQLEILELLYMRPGVPILLEWGWTTYVNNDGKLITDSSLPIMPQFWNKDQGGMNAVYRKIISNKEKTGGNYDGLMGMCKNFAFKARKDGGFDCSTEITAMGEIIESLKGRGGTSAYTGQVLAPFTVESTGGGPNLDAEVNALGELYDKFKPDEGDLDAFQLILIDLQCYLLMTDEVYGYTWKRKNINNFTQVSLEEAERMQNLWSGSNANNKEFIKDYVACLERAFMYFDLDKINDYFKNIPNSYAKTEAQLKSDYITNFLNHHGVRNKMPGYSHEDVHAYLENNEKEVNDGKLNDIDWPGAGWKTGFIKWDAVAYLLNKYAITPLANSDTEGAGDNIDEQSLNEPIIKIATKYIQNEEHNPGGTLGDTRSSHPSTRLRPYTYADVPMKGFGTGFHYSYTPEGTTKFLNRTPAQMCDRSFDHSVCFLPHGCKGGDFGGRETNSQWLNYPPFDLMYLSSPTDPKRSKIQDFINIENLKEEEQLRSIGNIMFIIDYLINTYQDMAYDQEDDTYIRKDDFSIYKYLEAIWSGVNKACGGAHKFIPHVDHEKPDLIRIIDMQVCEADLPDPTKIHQMNIQGNSTIVRDFTYNSLIPSALSATIGIAMQNPDSMQDLDGATFAAMAKNIKSRFIESKGNTEKTPPTDEQKEKWKKRYEQKAENLENTAKDLVVFDAMLRIGYGQTEAGDQEAADGRGFSVFDVYSAPTKQKSLFKQVLRIMGYENSNGTYSSGPLSGTKYYIGQPKPTPKMPNASSVIPLKFNAKLDGIGGIVIGNVFTIDPTRLPRGYKESDVAFVTTGESQKITAGNDWTTTINGQLTLLPFQTAPSTKASVGVVATGPKTTKTTTTTTQTPVTQTPSTPAAGMTKLSELKNTVDGGTGTELTPLKDLLSQLEGTDGPYPYGVYNYGAGEPGGNYETMPCSSVKGSKSNKDALGKPPINTLTMKELNRRMKEPHRVPASDGCSKNTGGPYNDNMDINGCHIFAAGKYQIIPKTLNGNHLPPHWNDNDIFDGPMQEKLGDILILQKRSRLRKYVKGENSGTEQDLINAVNDVGWEWASAPVITYAAQKYATRSNGSMSDVLGSVKTGAGNLGNYGGTGVNKQIKKTYVKNVVINLIHTRWQLAQKEGNPQKPDFRPDFMEFDLNNGDTLSGTKQIGES